MKLKVTKRFEVTTTSSEKIFAEIGDVISVSDRGAEYYNILKVRDTIIFSRWMRKPWVNAHCETS